MFHLEAIRLIAKNLRAAVENDEAGREGMALGQYIAGMGFSNVGLGIVHSMAHGLVALYDTPHGVACAILLPLGLEYNMPVVGERYRAIGKAMEVPYIDSMNDEDAAKATIAAVKKLGADVGIPADLKEIVKDEDVQFLSESAFADACCPGNPRDTSVEEIAALYDTPHGVACAILLPVGLEYNKTVAGKRYRAIGKAMEVAGIDRMTDEEAADATIAAVKQLSADVGIPANLHGILKEEDVLFLSESAFADACRPGNPRDTSVEEIAELYRSQL